MPMAGSNHLNAAFVGGVHLEGARAVQLRAVQGLRAECVDGLRVMRRCEERVALRKRLFQTMYPQRSQQRALAPGTGSTKINSKKYDRTAPPKSESITTSSVSHLSPMSLMSKCGMNCTWQRASAVEVLPVPGGP